MGRTVLNWGLKAVSPTPSGTKFESDTAQLSALGEAIFGIYPEVFAGFDCANERSTAGPRP